MMPSKVVFWKSNFTPSTCPSALPRSASKPSTVLLSVSKNSIGGKLTPEATRTVPEERMPAGRAAARVASLASAEDVADAGADAPPPPPEDEDAGLAASGAAHPEATAAVARAPTRTRERSRMVVSRLFSNRQQRLQEQHRGPHNAVSRVGAGSTAPDGAAEDLPHAPHTRLADEQRDPHRREAAGRAQGARLHPRAAGLGGRTDQGLPEPG